MGRTGFLNIVGGCCGTTPVHIDAIMALIAEKYQGIRLASGYPACPDHTEKATLWQILEAEFSNSRLKRNPTNQTQNGLVGASVQATQAIVCYKLFT